MGGEKGLLDAVDIDLECNKDTQRELSLVFFLHTGNTGR